MIVEVTRTYGNRPGVGEGHRVAQGARFAVGKEIDGLQTISDERCRRLAKLGLVRILTEGEGAAVKRLDPYWRAGARTYSRESRWPFDPARPRGFRIGADEAA